MDNFRKENNISEKVHPNALDWHELIKSIPTEVVEVDRKGTYDVKRSPDFHDWMING